MSRHQKFNAPAIILVVTLIVLVLDQWSKRAVISSFMPGESRLVVNHLLRWTFERNTHGAFGLFGNNGVLLIALALAVLVIFWFNFRSAAAESRLVCVAFGMIVGGAIGNIIDRVHFGYVVDFIDFYKIWPNIFNVADSCITIGVALLLLSSLGTSRRRA